MSGTRGFLPPCAPANDPAGDGVSNRIIIGPDGEIVGRQVRTLLDDGWRVIGFVGDFDADRDILDEFVRDVTRPES